MPKRILIIDDTPLIRQGVAEKLMLNDYEVLEARDGFEGLRLAREELPDVIICDIMMPELNGYEVLQELRGDSMTATIPFIFLTAKAEKPELRRGMELGADDYLTKPFKDDELLSAIQTRLEKRSSFEAEQLRNLTRRTLQLRDDHQRSLAHHIHNSISQPLAGLKLTMHGINRLSSTALDKKIDEVQHLVNQIHSMVTKTTHDLWPLVLDDLGLLSALIHLFDRYYSQSQIHIKFTHDGLDTPMSQRIQIAIYRVIEETLMNVAHHAQVNEVNISAWVEENIIQFDCYDNGVGFDLESTVAAGNTGGLVEMYERVTTLGGDLTILSEPDAGVRILFRIPIDEQSLADVEQNASHLPLPISSNSDITPPKSPATETHILIAEENDIIREGLKHLLDEVETFVICGEASQREQVLRLVRELEPDILILGISLSGASTLDLIRPAQDFASQLQILIFSGHANEMYSYEASRRGASGYVMNNVDGNELIQIVQHISEGNTYWGNSSSRDAMSEQYDPARSQDTTLSKYNTLTAREREILPLIAEGNTSKEIASLLSISPRTVETHRSNIAHKLGLRTQADLIRYAVQHGLTIQ